MNPYPIFPYYSQEIKCEPKPLSFPPQHQSQQPGLEYIMSPRPIFENPSYAGSGKLKGKTAIITGGDSGIGRAASIAFVKEGAQVVIVYLNEHPDAEETKQRIEQLGGQCLVIQADLRLKSNCASVVSQTIHTFGKLDILVNNIGVQFPQKSILDITEEQLLHTYQTNIFSFFFMTQSALPHLRAGSSIINTASITAYQGHKELIDYSSTKGAIVTFTRSLAMSLVDQGIRVNSVAPGPIWTPLIPSSYSATEVSVFGLDTAMKRAGQPFELAPAYVYLASDDSRFVTGETMHINGGAFITS